MVAGAISPAATSADQPAARPGGRAPDRVVRLFWAIWIGSLLPYAAYLWGGEVPFAYRDGLAFALLGAALAFACLVDLRTTADAETRRIRVLVALAFLCWAVEEPIETLIWNGEIAPLFALLELFFVAHYALLAAVAIGELRPGESAAARRSRRLGQLETALFATGLFLYCVFLPARFDPASAATFVPTTTFYVALDLLLVGLFLWRARRAEAADRRRWRLFALGSLLVAVGDGLSLVGLLAGWEVDHEVWLDPLWFLPYPAFVLAARAPARRTEPRPSAEADEAIGARSSLFPFAPGLLYAVLVPVTHLVFEVVAGGAPSPATEVQRVFALLFALGLAALAAYHQTLIARAHHALELEIGAARRRVAASQRLEAIGRLAGGVAHDFNNLLTVVLGRAELLLARATEAPARRDLETIVRTAARAADLTQELLAVGQRGMGVARRVDVRELIATSLAEIGTLCGDRIVVESRLAAEALPVAIDPAHLARVIRNLATNARDAMPEGGRLAIAALRRSLPGDGPAANPPLAAGDYAAIVVEDDGVGMDEATRRQLFEPFFTTKALGRGTGLGLATAYGLVRQYGGEISVATAPGRGARFEVLLPLAQGADEAAPAIAG